MGRSPSVSNSRHQEEVSHILAANLVPANKLHAHFMPANLAQKLEISYSGFPVYLETIACGTF